MTRRTVIGISDRGCPDLTPYAVGRVARARVLVGTTRHLACFPQFSGQKIVIDKDVTHLVGEIARLAAENDVCVLASHDPLFFGIGSRVVAAVGRQDVEIIPCPTAMQFAFAALGERWDDAVTLSLHGRPLFGLLSRLRGVAKAVLLTDLDNTPQRIARHLMEYGWDQVVCHLCEEMASDRQRMLTLTPAALAELPRCEGRNLLILERDPARDGGPLPHLPDDAYQPPVTHPRTTESEQEPRPTTGLITKREVRVLALSALRIKRDTVMWDIGAGSGAVAIEAARIATHGAVYSVERDHARLERAQAGARTHHADNIIFVPGEAPAALASLPRPGAIFVGGGASPCREVLTVSYGALVPGGVLTVSAVTFDKLSETLDFCREIGLVPDVTMVQCSRAAKVGTSLRYAALNPVHLISFTKPREERT